MKTKQILFLICLCFFSLPLWSQIQYKPLSSTERHEISSGISISIRNWQKDLSKNLPVMFLKYSLYFPETGSLFAESYKNIFVPGLSVGVNFFRTKDTGKDYNLCDEKNAFAYHVGLKGKSSYFELLQPFGEFGFTRAFCYTKSLFNNSKASLKLSHYFSYGLLWSLKILGRASVYALDQDYGINDIGIKTECRHYYPRDKEEKAFHFCQVGLQISF